MVTKIRAITVNMLNALVRCFVIEVSGMNLRYIPVRATNKRNVKNVLKFGTSTRNSTDKKKRISQIYANKLPIKFALMLDAPPQ